MSDAHPSPGDIILSHTPFQLPDVLNIGLMIRDMTDAEVAELPSRFAMPAEAAVWVRRFDVSDFVPVLLSSIIGLLNANHTNEATISSFGPAE